jgi:hypothetical protein
MTQSSRSRSSAASDKVGLVAIALLIARFGLALLVYR